MHEDEEPRTEAEGAESAGEDELAGSAGKERSPASWPWTLGALGAMVLMCLLVNHCHHPPAARGADAPAEVFSAERALDHLRRILADESPHPLGSSANDQVQQRLLEELNGLGLQPVTTEHWVSNEHEEAEVRDWVSGVARTRNVIAELPTSRPELPALVLACHYDSVPAGPGAGDDGAAMCALLEVARALKSRFPLPRPVVLLFTDGEELGLFGAQAFSEHHPLAQPGRVGMVLNFEARGSSGGSLLFQTSAGNRWLVKQAAAGLPRPMSSSAYVEIYRIMPNDSDLTVFMDHDMRGMNFAFVRNPKHYHTPLDNLENLDPRSVQHHGDNALGMVHQLLDADWEDPGIHDAVYTDVFARGIVAWSDSTGPFLASLLMIILLAVFVTLYLRQRWPLARIGGNLMCWFGALFSGAVFSWLCALLLDSADATPSRWPDAMATVVALHCLCGALGIVLAIFLFRGVPFLFFMIHAIMMALVGFMLSISSVSGFSYLFLLPATGSAAACLLLHRRETSALHFALACLIPGVFTAIAWIPLLIRIPYGLGVTVATELEIWVAPVFGIIFIFLALPFVPLLVEIKGRAILGLALVVVASTAWVYRDAATSPPFTANAPQHVNLIYLEEEGTPGAKLVVQALEGDAPKAITGDLPLLKKKPPSSFGGTRRRDQDRSAVVVDSASAPSPELEILDHQTSDGVHRARLRLRPSAPSQYLMTGVPHSKLITLEEIKIEGRALPVPNGRVDQHKWIRVRGAPQEGIEVELTWRGPEELPVVVAGITSGLPAHLAHFAEIRDNLPACSAHHGDQTIAMRHVTIR